MSIAETTFRLHKPCHNCPFRCDGGLELEPGRLDGIVTGLVQDDYSTFQCHKTVHNERTGGEWTDDGDYLPSGQESMCAGAIIYLEKLGRPTVGMRLGRMLGVYQPELLLPFYSDIIDPELPGKGLLSKGEQNDSPPNQSERYEHVEQCAKGSARRR
jgi:hypothetical protein